MSEQDYELWDTNERIEHLKTINAQLLEALECARGMLSAYGSPLDELQRIQMAEIYSAMKAAVSNFTVSLANTLAPDKITVNAVSPGPVWSQSWEKQAADEAGISGKDTQAVAAAIRSSTSPGVPLQRMGKPDDVAGLGLFLASDKASVITAAKCPVDGGILQNPY